MRQQPSSPKIWSKRALQLNIFLPIEEESTSGPAINGWLQRISAGGVHHWSTICYTPINNDILLEKNIYCYFNHTWQNMAFNQHKIRSPCLLVLNLDIQFPVQISDNKYRISVWCNSIFAWSKELKCWVINHHPFNQEKLITLVVYATYLS